MQAPSSFEAQVGGILERKNRGQGFENSFLMLHRIQRHVARASYRGNPVPRI